MTNSVTGIVVMVIGGASLIFGVWSLVSYLVDLSDVPNEYRSVTRYHGKYFWVIFFICLIVYDLVDR